MRKREEAHCTKERVGAVWRGTLVVVTASHALILPTNVSMF